MHSHITPGETKARQARLTCPGFRHVPEGTRGAGLDAGAKHCPSVLSGDLACLSPYAWRQEGAGTKRHLQLKMVCFILTNEASFKMQTTEEKHGLLEAFSLTVTMLGSQKY